MRDCERCGAAPPRFEAGPFAGKRGAHDYCEHCSADLCEKCMTRGKCAEAADGKHKRYEGDDDDLPIQKGEQG